MVVNVIKNLEMRRENKENCSYQAHTLKRDPPLYPPKPLLITYLPIQLNSLVIILFTTQHSFRRYAWGMCSHYDYYYYYCCNIKRVLIRWSVTHYVVPHAAVVTTIPSTSHTNSSSSSFCFCSMLFVAWGIIHNRNKTFMHVYCGPAAVPPELDFGGNGTVNWDVRPSITTHPPTSRWNKSIFNGTGYSRGFHY